MRETSATMVSISPYQIMLMQLEIERAKTARLQAENSELKAHINELRIIASTDHLTGLSNRRTFVEMTKRAIEISHSTNTPVSIVLCDIDKFKNFNDTEGHAGGDLGLKQFSKSLIAYEDEGAISGRMGGEEFAILLHGSTLYQAELFANKTRALVASSPVDLSSLREGAWRQITASFGVATYDQASGESVDQFLHRADLALYHAKGAGRNTVVSIDETGGFDKMDHDGTVKRLEGDISELGLLRVTRIRQITRNP